MAPLPQRPQSPLPETRGNLTFGGNGLMVNGDIPYTTPGQLRAMLSIQGGLSMPAVSERWIRGQLDLYSIPHDSQLPAAQLSGALENAVRAGNVCCLRRAPYSILIIYSARTCPRMSRTSFGTYSADTETRLAPHSANCGIGAPQTPRMPTISSSI